MVKHVKWVYDKRIGDYIINFNFDEDRIYFDWFVRIRDKQLVVGVNKDTLGELYESC